MKFNTSVLPTNGRGLSHLENVCVHEDGMEAKVNVDQDKVLWGKGTLHLYVAISTKFVRPDLVAAYVAYRFKKLGDTAIDAFFGEGFKVLIPTVWEVDGQMIHENSMEINCHRNEQHHSRYLQRKNDTKSSAIMDGDCNDRTMIEVMVRNIIQNRVYKRNLQSMVTDITNTVIKIGALKEKRSRVELMICKCVTLPVFADKIDQPTRDRTTAHYRASDHARNGMARRLRKLAGQKS